MRIRTIKPEFWSHEVMAQLPEFSRLLALALLNYADDEGYFLATPQAIRGALFPFEDESGRITGGLRDLSKVGYLEVKKAQDGRSVGRIVKFTKHQVVNKHSPSKIKDLWVLPEDSGSFPVKLPGGTGNREQGMEQGMEEKEIDKSISAPTKAIAFWSAHSGFEIPDEVLIRFQTAYPACDIPSQARRASEWLLANPKRRKKDHHRFLTNWLARAQERGGDIPANRPVNGIHNGASSQAPAVGKFQAPAGWREALMKHCDTNVDVPEKWEDLTYSVQSFALELCKEDGK